MPKNKKPSQSFELYNLAQDVVQLQADNEKLKAIVKLLYVTLSSCVIDDKGQNSDTSIQAFRTISEFINDL